MTKPLALEQLFTPTEIGPEIRPTDKVHKFFQDLRPHLECMPWNPELSMSQANESNRTFHPGEVSEFPSTISWVLKDPNDLMHTGLPTKNAHWEERLTAYSPDYSQQVTLKFVRNIFLESVINLDNDTQTTRQLSDLSFINVSVEATAPNNTDQLVATFEVSASFPEREFHGITRDVNCAPQLMSELKTLDEVSSWRRTVERKRVIQPTSDELAVLQQAAHCFTDAIEFIRSH